MSTSAVVVEHVAEHLGAHALGKAVPWIDAMLLAKDLYDIHEAWEEAQQKLAKLYAPCKR